MAIRVAYDLVSSTQAKATRLASGGAEPGTVVVARRQRQGRGRLDHAWTSPVGGLYMSVVERVPERSPQLLPIAVGVGLRELFAVEYGVESLLKWPNDLLVPVHAGSTAKLAGTLVDRVETKAGAPRLVVGVGVNVCVPRSSFPAALRRKAAVLAELCSSAPTVDEVEPLVTAVVRSAVERLDTREGAHAVVVECRRHLFGVGLPITIDGHPAGVLRDVAEDGAASVERNGARNRILAGDLDVEASG